jgi:sugar lactone lactonase YvrE
MSWLNLADGAGFTGTQTPTLAFIAAPSSLSGAQFRAVVTNADGSATSTSATLTVAPLPAGDVVAYDFTTLAGRIPTSIGGSGNVAEFYRRSSIAGNATFPDATNRTSRVVTQPPGHNDGTGSSAQFYRPYGVAVDFLGNAYVADTMNNTIRKITPAGVVTTLAGTPGVAGHADGPGAAASFISPQGIAVDSQGNLYVADYYNSTIRKINRSGNVTTLAGTAGNYGGSDGLGSSAQFNYPSGVAVDAAGNVYVADTFNSTIRKIDPSGNVMTLAGSPGVLGSNDGRGSAARFGLPWGVAVDAAGNVYVGDSTNNEIRKIDPSGNVTTLAGTPSPGFADGVGNTAQFEFIGDVVVDCAGNVYATDLNNNTIRRVTPAGVVTTVAGIPGESGGANGTDRYARFNGPVGLAVDGAGNIYAADTENCTIRLGVPTVVAPVAIVSQPQGTTIEAGQDAVIQVAVTGTAPLQFQWEMRAFGSANWADLADTGEFSGTTTESLALMGGTGGLDGAQFQCLVSNGVSGTTTVPVTLTVNYLSPIELQSNNETVVAGQPVCFSVGVSGNPAPGFLWQMSTDGGSTWTDLSEGGPFSGTHSANLLIGTATVAMSGEQFRVTAANGLGSVTSAAATLIVTPLGVGAAVVYDFVTIAGSAGTSGSTDGIGSAAKFNGPLGVATDIAGDIYVADTNNSSVRKITPTGVVTTLIRSSSIENNPTGLGSYSGPDAVFYGAYGAAVDNVGSVYVADSYTIDKVTPGGAATIVAGSEGNYGTADGTGSAALFDNLSGIAMDRAGNMYVADTSSCIIREMTPAGVVTTLAGSPNAPGSADGTGASARFQYPWGVAVDGAGNVYVADSLNDTVRKIAPGGAVTTLAGSPGNPGSTDGLGAAARFNHPSSLAVDGAGNVYVADLGNSAIRRIDSTGNVTTLGGSPGQVGSTDGTGSVSRFKNPYGVALDGAGNLYVSDSGNNTIRKGIPAMLSTIATQPVPQTVAAGETMVLKIAAAGIPTPTYQWEFNGVPIPGATGTTLTLPNIGTTQRGTYTVMVNFGTAIVLSNPVIVTVNTGGWLTNMSARAYVAPNASSAGLLIGGFVVSGPSPKELLARGVGPGLGTLGLTGFLPNPSLTFYSGATAGPTFSGWDSNLSSTFGTLGAFPLASGSSDTASVQSFSPGAHTVSLNAADGKQSGAALLELYDADQGAPANRLTNISARAYVGTSGNILVGGFVIGGSTSETVLIRAVGPGLSGTPFFVPTTLTTPLVQVYDTGSVDGLAENGPQIVASIQGWGGTPSGGPSAVKAGLQPATATIMNRLGAFSLPSGSSDSAMVLTLPPGAYTVQIQGADGGTGNALLEIYEIP